MKPLRKQPFERLAATIAAEQKQAEGDREAKRRAARQDYMPLSEVDGDDENVESESVESVMTKGMSLTQTAQLMFQRAMDLGFSAKSSDCGANAEGGHGFQPGNTCGTDGGQPANKIDIPEAQAEEHQLLEANAIPDPNSREDITRYLETVKGTAIHKKVAELLAAVEKNTITGDIRYASIEMNVKCCPDADDIKSGNIEFLPERQKLHKDIIGHILKKDTIAEAGKKPVAVLLIGPPGAGKSSAGNPIIQGLGVKLATVNNDEVKGALPEYKGWNAAMVHEESAYLVEKKLMKQALQENHNILFDGVGNSAGKMLKIAEGMKKNGYDVHMVHVTIPTEKTVARAWKRFAKNAFRDSPDGPVRYVPVDYVANVVDQNPTTTYQALRDSGHVSTWASYSNDVKRGEKPILIDKGEQQ